MDLTHIYFLHEIGEKANQEDYLWPEPGSASLEDRVFLVCDGVGGSDNGEVASRIISQYVGNAICKLGPSELSEAAINQLLSEAKQVLVKHARENRLNANMGTTLSVLALSARKAYVAWCGDSRIYHVRGGEIIYKTSDHSLVNSLVKSGEITEEEALTHPRRNLILRAIKADESTIEADYHEIENIQDGDYFLLCTDGLLENINDKNLTFLITENEKGNIDLVKAFQEFCFGKTKDNYSMYLVRVQVKAKTLLYKRKIRMLILFLVILISATGIILGRYFAKKQEIRVLPAVALPMDSTKKKVIDTIKKSTSITVPADVVVNPLNQKEPVVKNENDSASAKITNIKPQTGPSGVIAKTPGLGKRAGKNLNNDVSPDTQLTVPIGKPKALMPPPNDSVQQKNSTNHEDGWY